MKLEEWLKAKGVKRADFARSIGVSPGAVTQFCNQQGAWISRETATMILRETKGAVTPNDFLGLPAGDGPFGKGSAVADSINSALAAFKAGEIVVVADDDDREGEGDLFIAATLATSEKMAFVIRHTSGIVCAPLPADEARRLRLDPMVSVNDAPLGTAFTVSVDVRHGLTTGISAEERTNTVRALANGNTGAGDFVRPGHVFPLIARDGGVLMRSGHTEACIDLCRLAGLPPVGVLAELVNDDATVTKGKQVADFAKRHKLKLLTVADLIAYRQSREKLVERVASFPVETAIGPLLGHAFVTPFDTVNHFAFVHGEIGDGRDVLTRLHRAHIVQDVLGGGKAIAASLARFKEAGRGVLVYLRDGASGV